MNTLNNLFSGALGNILGSIIGVIGAYYLAVSTIRRTIKNDRVLTQERISVEAAGTIAINLVNFYDLLGELLHMNSEKGAEDPLETEPSFLTELVRTMRSLSRDITIEATLLPRNLAEEVSRARKAMRETFGVSATATVSKGQLLELRQVIRDTGDSLREYRRNSSSFQSLTEIL
jgi:hypothetical protein